MKVSKIKLAAIATTFLPSMTYGAISTGAGDAKPSGAPDCLFGSLDKAGNCTGGGGLFHTIADVLIFVTGAIAVLIIIFGGLRYVTSTGDAGRVKQAKDTILYGVVGLVVAILAYAIVAFVVNNLGKAT